MVTVRRVRRAPSFGVLATVVASLAFAAACLLPAPRVARADSKTSALTSIVTLQADDLVQVVDVHDTTTAPVGPAGSSKKMTIAQLFGSPSSGQLVGWGTVATPIALGSGLSLSNGTLTATGGSGSGTVNAGTSGQLAYYAADGTAVSGLGVGAGLSIVGGSLTATGGGGGSGTVTSVGLTVPSWLSVTGSPVTSSGTLAVSAASAQAQNKVLASPNGSSGAVSLRSLVGADLPVFVASGASHAAGAVPDPGSTAGTTKFLREDSTWAVPAGGAGGSPGGSTGQVQYNSAGAFAGASGLKIGSSGEAVLAPMSAPGTPSLGSVFIDSSRSALTVYEGPTGAGRLKYLPRSLYSQVANVTVSASGANSLISTTGAAGSVTLTAGQLNVPGKRLRVTAISFLTTGATNNTVGYYVTFGGNCVASSVMPTCTGAFAGLCVYTQADITVKTTGTTGTVEAGGYWASLGFTNPMNAISSSATIGTRGSTPVTIDLTQSYSIDVGVNFNTTGNSCTSSIISIEEYN